MPNLLKKKTNKPSESKRKGKNTENILNKLLKKFLIIFLFNKQKKKQKISDSLSHLPKYSKRLNLFCKSFKLSKLILQALIVYYTKKRTNLMNIAKQEKDRKIEEGRMIKMRLIFVA